MSAPEQTGEGPAGGVPLDTDDTRGAHFSSLLRSPLTISLALTGAIIAFVAVTGAAGAGPGAGAGVGVALLAVLIVFAIASSRAKEDFFSAYAQGRGLRRQKQSGLPPTTPLLRKGDKRYGNQVMNGTLAGGLQGTLALYTYETHSTDSKGRRQTHYHRFTVVLHDVPATAARIGELRCQRRSGFRFMDGAEDVFRKMQRLELESEALDKRFEIFYGRGDEENWLKQLFSPSFIVWLSEQAPDDTAFELSAGSLCVSVPSHHDSAAELDGLCEAAGRIAVRLAEEAAE